ncbi:putative motility protein [Uliginosibacterium gangwonense]|uniref:putative motility protein n=1 Tax=Uliginosibacterium gangwonense TaxID=392736 RepID=UPI000368214E|nr:putative motility protein [Uliginosibacterium gangwonense]
MDVSALSSAASNAQLGTVQSAVQVDVLKQAMDMQAQQVQQLLQSVPTPGQAGGVINTYA